MNECNNNAVLDHRVTNLERGFERVSAAVESIAESLNTLTRLEAHHEETRAGVTRAFIAIEKCDLKIDSLSNIRVKALEDTRVKESDCHMCRDAQKEIADKHGEKISAIESEMQSLKMVRGWVLAGVTGIMGILGAAVLHLVMK